MTVTPVNESSPVITSDGGGATAAVNVTENSTAVTTVTATDADLPAQTLAYSISGGADAARFTINPSTGVLTFVRPRTTRARPMRCEQRVRRDGAGPRRRADGYAGDRRDRDRGQRQQRGRHIQRRRRHGPISLAENTTAVTTVVATDADLPAQTLTYSISGGADGALFTIDGASGALSFYRRRTTKCRPIPVATTFTT